MNRFRILAVVEIEGRSDRLASLETLSRSVWKVNGPLRCPQSPGEWTFTSVAHSDPPQAGREAVGLAGPPGLAQGMELESP